MTTTGYDTILGPAVRIGVLQHQSAIRMTLRGEYRVSGSGKPCGVSRDGTEFSFAPRDAVAADLQ